MGRPAKTTEDFIREAIEIHGDKYDYSLVEYKDNLTKVPVICKKCRELGQDYIFEIRPTHHLRKNQPSGCPRCAKRNRTMTQEKFIERAKEKFPHFDYSKVEYKNMQTKVTIICPRHGEFKITPNTLLYSKYGCKKCSLENYNPVVKDTESFIKKAIEIHGQDKYDYKLVKYTNSKDHVEIICNKCSEELGYQYVFKIRAASFLHGRGCRRCSSNASLSIDEVKDRLKKVHNGTIIILDNYIDNGTRYRANFECLVCGHRWVTTIGHVITGKSGCPVCARNRTIDACRTGLEEIKKQVYNVSNGNIKCIDNEYVNERAPMKFKCMRCHNTFIKPSRNVLRSPICPFCDGSGGFDPTKPAILYYIRVNHNGKTYYKIGITNYTIEKRFRLSDREKMTILKTWEFAFGEDARKIEQKILETYSKFRYTGDEIILQSSGNTELFTDDVLGLDVPISTDNP